MERRAGTGTGAGVQQAGGWSVYNGSALSRRLGCALVSRWEEGSSSGGGAGRWSWAAAMAAMAVVDGGGMGMGVGVGVGVDKGLGLGAAPLCCMESGMLTCSRASRRHLRPPDALSIPRPASDPANPAPRRGPTRLEHANLGAVRMQ